MPKSADLPTVPPAFPVDAEEANKLHAANLRKIAQEKMARLRARSALNGNGEIVEFDGAMEHWIGTIILRKADWIDDQVPLSIQPKLPNI